MPTHSLPQPPTPFVGREAELNEIAALMTGSDCRLLTLLGPGGIGKTRLAIEATKRLQDHFTNGVYFVNFQPVDSTDFLPSTIADAVNMPSSGQEDLRTLLLNFLHNKEMLLVLDNFEHLLGGAGLLTDVLHAAPAVKLLITSREILSLQEEWLYPVQGMPYPQTEDAERLETYSAVQLFVERARRVRRNFSLSDEQAGVVRMCRMLEGMPLAIELAAAWTKTLPCVQIASEIQRNLDFLVTNMRNIPERHRSMQAVFQQSWNLLTVEECGVFRTLSVFRGGFQREAAEQVAGASLAILASLVDKSLLVSDTHGRYQIHELVRQYGERQLQTLPEEMIRVRDLHCAYYTDFIHAHSDIHGGEQLRAAAELEAELDNIRRAWLWAVEQANAEAIQRSAHTLSQFYQYKSRYLEATDAFGKAMTRLDQLEPTQTQQFALATVLVNMGWFWLRLGQIENARAGLERSHTIFESLNMPPQAFAATEPLAALSIVLVVQGDYGRAVQIGEQGRDACQARGDKGNLISCALALASALMAQGDYQAAKQCAQQGCAIAQELSHRYLLSYCLNLLGSATQALGDVAEAQLHYQVSYTLREEFDDAEGMAVALNHLGKLAWMQGDYPEAKRHYQRSLALYQNIGDQGGLVGALLGLGLADCKLEDDHSARQHFYGALHTALEARLMPLVMTVIVSIVELFPESWSQTLAIELLILVFDHPASDYETRERAQHLLTKYQIAPDHLAEIRQQVNFNISTSALLIELRKPVETRSLARDSHDDDWQLLDPLTEREREVMRLIADGLSNHAIASKLFISIGTVKWYCSQIYDKLGVESRTQAILRAQELNLLS